MRAAAVIANDTASPAVKQLRFQAHGRRAFAAMGASVAESIRRHLVQRDLIPNQLGGRRTHFFSSAARQTFWVAREDEAEVSIAKDGIRQRLLGGIIRPVRKKALTIPVSPEAYGRRASEFGSELRLVKLSGGADGQTAGLLVLGEGPHAPAMYVLRTQVHQAPDPSVLPADADLKAAAVAGLEELRLAEMP